MLAPYETDPFSLCAIKDSPTPALLPLHPVWEGFLFDTSLESELLRLNENKTDLLPGLKADVFHLDLQDVPLPDLSTSPSIPTSDSEDDCFQSLDGDEAEDEAIDVWALPDVVKRRSDTPLASWDTFLDQSHQEPVSAYPSEAQSVRFSSLLNGKERDTLRVVKSHVLLRAFIELCLGRESVLFNWEERHRAFVPVWANITAHGCSRLLVQSCFDEFADVGMRTRMHRKSLHALDRTSNHLSPIHIALLATFRSILHAINKQLCLTGHSIVSLLQLKGHMSKIWTILDVLDRCHNVLESKQTDPYVVQSLIKGVAMTSLSQPGLMDVLQLLVTRTCQPLLALLGEQIGLNSVQSRDSPDSFTDAQLSDEGFWIPLLEPNFADAIREAHQSLNLLKTHSPDCSLLSATVLRSSPLKTLDLGFTFESISRRQSRAVAYEEAMKSLIVSAESSASTSMLETPTSESFELEEFIVTLTPAANLFRLETDLFEHGTTEMEESTVDELQTQVILFLEGRTAEELILPLGFEESFSLSIVPLISAQHRLLSYSVLQLAFQDHNLQGHLNLQRSFHMLGNAFFSSRLRTALFDSDQLSGEAQRKTGASTGLRLEARDSWPPAGSELRLVLMSILSDSLTAQDRPLEDCTSFAIRDMPAEDLEKCRDVDSIHALDFLRLQYNAPNETLGAVITPQILDKCDRIFQHLLRTMRLHAVTQRMLRDDVCQEADIASRPPRDKTAIEMHHFISTVADYCHTIAIQAHWTKFETILRDAKSSIDSQNYEETLRVVKSLHHLRVLHERTLDNILHALLLKHKHAAVRQILEDIYGVILRFSAERRTLQKSIAEGKQTGTSSPQETLSRLGEDFRLNVMQFMAALRSGKQATRQASERDVLEELDDIGGGVDMSECLLLRMDMSSYWSKQKSNSLAVEALPIDLL